MSRRNRLASPGKHQQQRLATQPTTEIGDRVQRRLVRGVDVIEQHDAGLRATAGGADHRRDGLQQAYLGAGSLEGQRRGQVGSQARDLGEEERGVRQTLRRNGVGPARLAVPYGCAQQLDDWPVGKTGLVVVTARRKHHGPAAARVARELMGQARLAYACLALYHCQTAIGTRLAVGRDQHRELAVSSH